MSSWKKCKLGDVMDLFQGLAINSKTKYLLVEKSDLPLLRIKDLQENTAEFFVNESEVPEKCIANENDLIFTRTGIVGLVFMGKKGVVHNNCFRIVPKIDDIFLKFYYYYFNREDMREYLTGISAGSVQPDMNHSIFKNEIIPVPPLEEQKAIAEILSSLDDKIDLLHRQNQTLESLAQTLFRQWFIEEAKEEWEIKFSDAPIQIIDGDRGNNYPKNSDFFTNEYCLFLSAKNVTKNGFDFLDCQFITKERDELLRKGKLSRYDVVLTTRGTVGNIAYYHELIPFENIRINSGMVILKADETKISSLYLYILMKSPLFTESVIGHTSGSAQPQLPIRDLNNVSFILPPEDIYNKFMEQVKPIYSKVFSNQKQIQTLENLRDTLLPKLLSGEVRVGI